LKKLIDMIVTVKLEKSDYNSLSDILHSVNGNEVDNEDALQYLWDWILTDDVKGTAIRWGIDDSVARDEIYECLVKYKEEKDKK